MSAATTNNGWSGIGSRLRRQRQLLGWTQLQLANRLGLAKSTVSQYENNINEPDYAVLIRLCRLLDVTSDYMLGLDKPPPDENKTGQPSGSGQPAELSIASPAPAASMEQELNAPEMTLTADEKVFLLASLDAYRQAQRLKQ
ncbi:helix-turn-helix domain-containing protein [Paenibacillus pasadenensis]|uniref:helix-turn-helix domain-containing protein n=1 Tax=Paenibacillus pasadenensis TaxID=217090 RepID=UPI00203E3867|nr:helix-turn-helix domain-containing protein [Paenibacillus pasadenensis]